jgi:hypothetical protein
MKRKGSGKNSFLSESGFKNKFLAFILSSTIFICTANAQTKSLDSLVNTAFISIRNSDAQAYIKLFPTYPQLLNFFSGILKTIGDTSLKKNFSKLLGDITQEKYEVELKEKYIISFQNLIQEGTKMGIIWRNVKMDSFTKNEIIPPDIKLRSASGSLYISDAGKSYVIPYTDVVWSDEEQGWFGFGVSRIFNKGDENNDTLVFQTDSVEKTVTVSPPEPLPPIKKPVTKKPPAKQPAVKPKTTTKPKN